MAEDAFQTARFEIHNPSRHKQAMLLSAMRSYHQMVKETLERALADPAALQQNCLGRPNAKGQASPNGFSTSKYVRTLTRKGWNLAPLREYVISDVTAALMSYLQKNHKGKNKANPPTLPALQAISPEEYRQAYQDVMLQTEFEPSPEHQKKIDKERAAGHPRVAHRLERIFTGRAATKALAQLLRKTKGPLPRPIEFTHCEFGRGFLLARKDNRYYCLLKLFSPDHRHYEKKTLETRFTDIKTGEDLSGKKYPGMILPLAMSREFHAEEYLRFGSPQSAKLVVRRDEHGKYRFFIHVAFRFSPVRLPVETILGIDRGAAIIGAASILGMDGKQLATGLNLDGAAFAAEMQWHEHRIRDMQKRGIQKKGRKGTRFRLRGLRADAILGEYANKIIEQAVKHKSQIVIEKINQVNMGLFLKQSQFAKLQSMLAYKAKRQGLPEPLEVPAAYTSQTCSKCGHTARENRPKKDAQGNAIQDCFRCVQCGHQANADGNASIVIALRGLHQVQQGGKFQRWPVFADWLKTELGRDGRVTGQ
ncbi:MAG: RNA-guided endonuclease InsQ/TnpB family protein [Acidobacteriaceae bacterium]